MRDICPFTTMGLFNRGMTDANRKIIAGELARFLGVEETIPETFEGIPLLNNMKSWYFPPEAKRDAITLIRYGAFLPPASHSRTPTMMRAGRPLLRLSTTPTCVVALVGI